MVALGGLSFFKSICLYWFRTLKRKPSMSVKRPVFVLFFTLITVCTPNAQLRELKILSHGEAIFINDNCRDNKTCDLKKVRYVVEDYQVTMMDGEYNLGTRMFAQFETNSVRNLKKYVFAQFIKGCVFSSKLVSGQRIVEYDHAYPRDKKPVALNFKNWVIDSYDYDPVYSTVPGKSRFFGYRWNTVPDSFSTDTEKLYGQVKPRKPKLYLVDHPGTAFIMNGKAKNISLEFKICIYRERDVPKSVSPDNVNFAKPVDCFNWHSSFVYNHQTNEYESYSQVVSTCQ